MLVELSRFTESVTNAFSAAPSGLLRSCAQYQVEQVKEPTIRGHRVICGTSEARDTRTPKLEQPHTKFSYSECWETFRRSNQNNIANVELGNQGRDQVQNPAWES